MCKVFLTVIVENCPDELRPEIDRIVKEYRDKLKADILDLKEKHRSINAHLQILRY